MPMCYYKYRSNRNNPIWGNHVIQFNIEDAIVKHCRKAFGKLYRNMWILPISFDDTYLNHTEDFFKTVYVELYPRLSNLSKEIENAGFTKPKTKEEWDSYRALVWEIIHGDISENICRGIAPINVIVTGVRFATDKQKNKYRQKILSIKVVDRLPERKSSND